MNSVISSVCYGVNGVKLCVECVDFFPGCGQITVRIRDVVVVLNVAFCLCVVTRVPHQVRRSRFLLRLWEVGHALQPMGEEHVYLSSRRIIGP